MIDARGVLAHDHRRALLDGVLRSALADARDALVGLDRHNVEALIEVKWRVGIVIEADAGDFHCRCRRSIQARQHGGARKAGGSNTPGLEKRNGAYPLLPKLFLPSASHTQPPGWGNG